MRSVDAFAFTALTANSIPFHLMGGKYAVDAVATFSSGSVKLQRLGPDGSTYLSVASATDFSAAGYATVDLPQGTYRFTIATATAVACSIVRIPMGE